MTTQATATAIARQFIAAAHASSNAAERGQDTAEHEAGGAQMALLELTVTLDLEHQMIAEVNAKDPSLGRILPELLDTYR